MPVQLVQPAGSWYMSGMMHNLDDGFAEPHVMMFLTVAQQQVAAHVVFEA